MSYTEHTWLGLPHPCLCKGTSGNALLGCSKCSNGMSSEGSRRQRRVKQNTIKITLTVQIVKYPKYCIQEKLRQLNSYWKYKNTKFCYIKKLPKPQHSPSVASTSCSLVSPNAVQHSQRGYFGKQNIPHEFSLKPREPNLVGFAFFFFFPLPSREKINLTL